MPQLRRCLLLVIYEKGKEYREKNKKRNACQRIEAHDMHFFIYYIPQNCQKIKTGTAIATEV